MLKLSQNSVCETRQVFHSSLTSSCWLLADKELLRVDPKVPSLGIQHKPTESCSPAHHQATGRALLAGLDKNDWQKKNEIYFDWLKMWVWRPKLMMYTRCMIDALLFFVRGPYCKKEHRKLLLSLREASSWVTLKKASQPQQLGIYFKYFSCTVWDFLFSAPRQLTSRTCTTLIHPPPPKKQLCTAKIKEIWDDNALILFLTRA